MNISDVANVLAVYEELSFTKAAQRLYVSQSAVSQSIARVEKEWNVRLFIRCNNAVRPTPACMTFMQTGKEIISLWKQLHVDMEKISAKHGPRLRIGTASFFFKFLTYQSDVFQNERWLDFEFEIIEDKANIEEMTVNGQVDFCFTRMPLQQKTLHYEPLFTETVMLAAHAAHPICQRHPCAKGERFATIDLAELEEEPFVMINNPRITPMCMQMCKEAGFIPNISLRTNTWEHVYAYVRTGRAVGFISCLHVDQEGGSSPVRFFRIDSPNASMEHVVGYLSRSMISQNARLYIDAMREHIAKRLPI